MPIYEYECPKCGVFEFSQTISEAPIKRCPTCRRAVTKLLSASAFHLKGGGWYTDGYNKGGPKDGAEKGGKTESAAPATEKKTKPDSPTKPASGPKATSGDAS